MGRLRFSSRWILAYVYEQWVEDATAALGG
jgi:hypothetical protein